MIDENIQDSVEEEKREHFIYQYSARGIPVESIDDYRAAINVSDKIYELSFYEALVWYSCLFDSFDRNDLLNRFIKSYCKVNGGYCIDYRKHFNKAFERLTKDNLLCEGQGGNRMDAIFDMFASASIRIVNSPQNKKNGYTNGVDVNPDILDFEYAVQTPEGKLPLRQDEKIFMDMLQAGHCDIKDIEKKISQDSDTTMFEGKIPPQKQVAFIGVCLLRKRRIILL